MAWRDLVKDRRGNRHRSIAPHGVYRCSGEDSWVAIAVENDAQFAALCETIGRPELARDERYADVVSRYRNQDGLDPIISEWTAGRAHREAAEQLQAADVPAEPVLTIPELVVDPHLTERGFWEEVTHRDSGTWTTEAPAWRFSRAPAHVRLPAPAFGEHNDYVFGELLGLSADEIVALERDACCGLSGFAAPQRQRPAADHVGRQSWSAAGGVARRAAIQRRVRGASPVARAPEEPRRPASPQDLAGRSLRQRPPRASRARAPCQRGAQAPACQRRLHGGGDRHNARGLSPGRDAELSRLLRMACHLTRCSQ